MKAAFVHECPTRNAGGLCWSWKTIHSSAACIETLRLIGGYAVVAAEDGVAALRYCDAATPEAVVLDLGLPRLSGRDVQQELATHRETRHIPIIVVTGDSSALNVSDFACVLRKPIDVADLVAAVQRCLRE